MREIIAHTLKRACTHMHPFFLALHAQRSRFLRQRASYDSVNDRAHWRSCIIHTEKEKRVNCMTKLIAHTHTHTHTHTSLLPASHEQATTKPIAYTTRLLHVALHTQWS